MSRRVLALFTVFAALSGAALLGQGGTLPVATTLQDFFLPGSQPDQSGQLQTPDKCDNCHGGYDATVEPAFNWRGSMMAQAARDPLFYAAMTIANQDAAESGDLCIRCHSPAGWLEGRSTPTDGSALNNNDREGVQCDFCHKLVRPSELGVNPYFTDADYTAGTYAQDQGYLASLSVIPGWSANGAYVADANNAKRGPFTDSAARHQTFYSPFHQDAALCGTCHDVSNPVFSRQGDSYAPNTFGHRADFDNGDFDPAKMLPVERTYSEWTRSAFANGGVDMEGRFGGNKRIVSTCQDCHMPDVTGLAANKNGTPVRSDLPLHDLVGGNTFVPLTLAALWPGEVDQAALDAGVARARSLLERAATLEASSPTPGVLRVRVTNETAHKLPSGYPEGRRIWINVRLRDGTGALVAESGRYDSPTATLVPDAGLKVYEIKPGLSAGLAGVLGLSPGPSFHFVLNDIVVEDNRIPPRGFTNAAFQEIQSPPVGYAYADGQYWDDTDYALPAGAVYAEVRLFYQTVSREFIEFLRDENRTNDWGNQLYTAWLETGRSAPELMAMATWGSPPVDVTPPSAPSGLSATAVSRSVADLSWLAATDNIGVAGYYVYRDGSRVADVTGLTYADQGLKGRTTYCYAVSAFDAAGNESSVSGAACVTTPKR